MTDYRTGLFRNGTAWCSKDELERLRRDAEGGDKEAKRRVLRAEMRCGDFKSKAGKELGKTMLEASSSKHKPHIDVRAIVPRFYKAFFEKHFVPAIEAVDSNARSWRIAGPYTAVGRTTPATSTKTYWGDYFLVHILGNPTQGAKDLKNVVRYIKLFDNISDDWHIEFKSHTPGTISEDRIDVRYYGEDG